MTIVHNLRFPRISSHFLALILRSEGPHALGVPDGPGTHRGGEPWRRTTEPH